MNNYYPISKAKIHVWSTIMQLSLDNSADQMCMFILRIYELMCAMICVHAKRQHKYSKDTTVNLYITWCICMHACHGHIQLFLLCSCEVIFRYSARRIKEKYAATAAVSTQPKLQYSLSSGNDDRVRCQNTLRGHFNWECKFCYLRALKYVYPIFQRALGESFKGTG